MCNLASSTRADSLLGISITMWLSMLVGCNTQRVVEHPGKITLEEALQSVGRSLVQMQEAKLQALNDALARQAEAEKANTALVKWDRKTFEFGLLPGEITVTFNVTASAKDAAEGKLFVEAGAPAPTSLSVAKAGGEFGASTEITASRGNQITLKLQNIYFAPTTTLIGARTPADIDAIVRNINDNAWVLAVPPRPQPNQPK